MWTLALETTSAAGSLALLEDDTLRGERDLAPRAYSTELFPRIEELLRERGIELADIDLFAVADGPGSFTGVRVGLTAVKAWVEVLGRPAAPVSTLRAVAFAGAGFEQPAAGGLDASRGELYLGLYPEGADRPAGEELLVSPETAARRAAEAGLRLWTPHPHLVELCPQAELVPARLAAAVGRLGRRLHARGESVDALRLDARYIRASDAELYATPRLD